MISVDFLTEDDPDSELIIDLDGQEEPDILLMEQDDAYDLAIGILRLIGKGREPHRPVLHPIH